VRGWAFANGILSLTTTTHELLQIDTSGALVERTAQPALIDLVLTPEGSLLAFAGGALWQVGTPAADGIAAASALVAAPDGRLFAVEAQTASAYDAARQLLWQVALPDIAGFARLSVVDDVLLLTTQHGQILVLRAADGAVCGAVRVYGDDRAQVWHRVGQDGVLRVAVADQLFGFDWRILRGPCV
jgi:hypothetical protein